LSLVLYQKHGLQDSCEARVSPERPALDCPSYDVGSLEVAALVHRDTEVLVDRDIRDSYAIDLSSLVVFLRAAQSNRLVRLRPCRLTAFVVRWERGTRQMSIFSILFRPTKQPLRIGYHPAFHAARTSTSISEQRLR